MQETEVMRMQELTEEEQRIRQSGLRMLARIIAQHFLATRAKEAAAAHAESEQRDAGAEDAGRIGDQG